MPEVMHLASQKNPDIIAVTETWLSSQIPKGAIHIHGYNLTVRTDGHNNKRGGGSAIYVKASIHARERHDLKTGPEGAWCEVMGYEKLVVACLYRPPGSDLLQFTNELEVSPTKLPPNQKLLIVGDFNATAQIGAPQTASIKLQESWNHSFKLLG